MNRKLFGGFGQVPPDLYPRQVRAGAMVPIAQEQARRDIPSQAYTGNAIYL